MANYINRTILCQAYVHMDVDEKSDLDPEELVASIESYLSERAKFFFDSDTDVEVEAKEGSLVVYATVVGGIYLFVHKYPSFREGVILLAKDVHWLSSGTIAETLFRSRIKHGETKHIESRPGVFGKLADLLTQMDSIRAKNQTSTPRVAANRMERLADETSRLLDQVADVEDVDYVKKELLTEAKSVLGRSSPKGKQSKSTQEDLARYRTEYRRLIQILS